MVHVELPPHRPPLADGSRIGGWWHSTSDSGQITCDLCPRECHLRPGDRGFCFVRENRDGEMVLSTYGRSTGFCIDPIEKKPLNHFYPGTSVLSFGTAGCNLGCKFCQNWSISKSREVESLSEIAMPEAVAQAAVTSGCRSVAFTYNDPVVWAEYAIDTALACKAVGVKTVAVTAGYITDKARRPFYEVIDAANVDLKGFTEEFYWKLTSSHLQPVLDTLRWLKQETNVWLEITNLIIPQANDSSDELRQLCDWVLSACGPDVPVHFTAFHPDFKLTDRERTPPETLLRAYEIAIQSGLRFPYVGNIQSPREQSTYCPNCRRAVIERSGYTIQRYDVAQGCCRHCGTTIAGHFDSQPGDWGARRQPIRIADFQKPLITLQPQVRPTSMNSPQVPTAINQVPQFSPEQGQAILAAAAEFFAAAVENRRPQLADASILGTATVPILGAFVTAKRAEKLRSCRGSLGQVMPLGKSIALAAEWTATKDSRFPPITTSELPYLHLDVWILHAERPVTASGEARRAAVIIGKHGLTISRGDKRGLLLPGVAIEHHLDAEQFLKQVCLKAGLPPTAWKESDTQLATFEGVEFAGNLNEILVNRPSSFKPWPKFSPHELTALAEYCHGNILAAMHGSTPNYFAHGVADGNVQGVVLKFHLDETIFWQTQQISLKDRIPLQSTLFALAHQIGRSLATRRPSSREVSQGRVELAILTDTALHGGATKVDLRGVVPTERALVAVERNKVGIVFNPQQALMKSVGEALQTAKAYSPEGTAIYSLAVQTNGGPFVVAQVPEATRGPETRPTAVAGTFYPKDPHELAALVDECCGEIPARKERWSAVMVPHAGLIFSGRLAGRTLAQIEIPQTVIIIGPKHTPKGVEWAVAPHAMWELPGANVAADQDIAQRLAAAIPGLELDAGAHEREHAIEVELPFLAKLSPQSRVIGITIGAGSYARCQEFARGLATVIRELPSPPLLVISSDMNHFASDRENRRLDEMALLAVESLDPQRLFDTVQEQQISMCGALPAVIVMETLRQLGGLKETRRAGYATSADVTGDTSRVVGYAGMLLR